MDAIKDISVEANSDPENVAVENELEAGALGMSNGEHRDEIDLSGKKFYVMGRGRYKAHHYDASDNDRDWRNELPLDFYSFFNYFNSEERSDSFKTAWKNLKSYFATLGPRGPANRKEERIRKEFQKVWKIMVKDNLEAHNGLVTSIEHEPNMHREGYFCYDVKLCRLMGKKRSKDLDINRDISKTRAIEILRILHTRIQTLPKEFVNALFKGPQKNGRYIGLFKDDDWPENEADEPFSNNMDEDFQFRDDFVDEDGGPIFLIRKNTPGHVILEMRKDPPPESASESSGESSDGESSDGESSDGEDRGGRPSGADQIEEVPQTPSRRPSRTPAAPQTTPRTTRSQTAQQRAAAEAEEEDEERPSDFNTDLAGPRKEKLEASIVTFKTLLVSKSLFDEKIKPLLTKFPPQKRTAQYTVDKIKSFLDKNIQYEEKDIKFDSKDSEQKKENTTDLINNIFKYIFLSKRNVDYPVGQHNFAGFLNDCDKYFAIIDKDLDLIIGKKVLDGIKPLVAKYVHTLAAGQLRNGPISNELYTTLCGGQSKNKFGSALDLGNLSWASKNTSHVGLLIDNDRIMVLAHSFGDPNDMKLMMQEIHDGPFYVWIPPKGLGRNDGYFSNMDTDYEAVLPWALHFNAKAQSSLTDPKNNEEILLYKLLKNNNKPLNIDDYGLRGGHFILIE
jgi:hypothetical protein